jgi:UDP-N-acetylmuramyl pentapeptide synthase
VETRDADTSVLVFEIKVRNRKHLARIVRIIRRMPDVLRVTRTIAAHARDHGHKYPENLKGSS